MPKTLHIEQIRDGFEKRGYTLLSKEYVNSKQKLHYRCPNRHENETTWNTFHRGSRCPECWEKRKRELKLTPFDEIQQKFSEEGYILISQSYTSGKQRLESLCRRGHSHNPTMGQWNCGYRCMKCWGIEHRGENNPNWNPDREAVVHNKKVWTAWRNLLRGGVSGRNKFASDKVFAILGYNWSDLRRHVQSHPNWESCKNDYQIDHIFPVKAFRDYGITLPKIVNALDNLRPLSTVENHRKNKFYDRIAFENYLKSKGIQWQKEITTLPISKS